MREEEKILFINYKIGKRIKSQLLEIGGMYIHESKCTITSI